jgi:PAS domain S-box-containing protein
MATSEQRNLPQEAPCAARALQVVHLEDNPEDAELIGVCLCDGGLACDIRVVDNEAGFAEAIGRGGVDLILADYSLPGFDGMSALEIARRACPEVPFLFVSGAIGEEQAIETLKSGAVDYVLKQRLERLVPAVRRALREAEDRRLRRRAEESLRQSEDRLRKAHDELEIRVRERTRELAQANTALEAEVAERTRAETELHRVNKALHILTECNQILVRATDENHLLRSICQVAVEFGGYDVAWVGQAEQEEPWTVRPLAWAGCQEDLLAGQQTAWADGDRGPTGRAIRTGSPAVLRNLAEAAEFEPWRAAAIARGWAAAIGVPLVVDGRVFGAMTLYSTDAGSFDDTEVRLLQELADDLGFGIASLRLRVERQRTLEALQASEERYRRIVETAEEGIWMLDEAGGTTFVNQKMAQMLGYTVEEMAGASILSYVDPRDRARVEYALHRRRTGIRERHDVRFRRRDGSELWVILAGTPIFDEAGRYRGSLKMATDITERKRLERGLAEISSLEQQRIGRDLHDVLGQNITGISFLSKILEQKLSSLALSEAQEAAEIGRLAALTNKQARTLARGLAPVDLTAASFEAGIKELAAGVQEVFSISCACQCDPNVRIPNDDAALHLYRIAQEAVNNAVKHGHARNILIQLTEQDGRGMLMVQDDGRGMPERVQTHDGMGMQIMNYRASAIGGQLRIRSSANQGTVVVCTFGRTVS